LPELSDARKALLEKWRRGQGSAAPEPIPRRPDGPAPLSFSQQRLWFLARMEAGSTTYHMYRSARLRGPLDVATLAWSLREIVRRHESLRTTIRLDGVEPVQVVDPEPRFHLPLVSVEALPPDDREIVARELAAAESARPFDLENGPLLRALLVRLGPEDHALLLCIHHVVFDGASMGVLLRELSALYATRTPLPEPALQYADWARWQREQMQGQTLERLLAWWRERLAGELPVLELPSDTPRGATRSLRGARQHLSLPAAASARLKASLAGMPGVTLFMVLLAGFQALLQRYTGQEDLLVGTPVANRARRELGELIGLFVNTVVVRTDLAGDPTWRELLTRVKQVALGAFSHQDLPFERLVEELQPERDLAHTPLFQVLFVLDNATTPALVLEGVTVGSLDLRPRTAPFELTLDLFDSPAGIAGWIDYPRDLFEALTLARLAGHLATLLAGAADDPDRRLSELPLLSAAEERQVLVEWNGPRQPREEGLVHTWIERWAVRTPEAPAVAFPGATLSYGELDRRASLLARLLRARGVAPEARVGIFLERSPEAVVAILAVLKAGGAYVPLDPAQPAERLAGMIEEIEAPLILSQERLRPQIPAGWSDVLALDSVDLESFMDSAALLGPRLSGESAAYAIYTSGSTGRPKAVVCTHGSLLNLTLTMRDRLALGPGQRLLLVPALSFDASVGTLFPTLAGGACVVLHPDPSALSGVELERFCAEQGVTAMDIPAAAWSQWVEDLAAAGMGDGELLPKLERVVSGGEGVTLERIRTWERLTAGRAAFHLFYGPTEATVCTTVHRTSPPTASARATHLPIGRPLPNVEVYLLDRSLRPVPAGVAGEICIGGSGVARSYLSRPDATAERFVPSPFGEAGARLYRTGDLARWRPDGEIEFLGRLDHQVKIRGFRVEPAEIEAALQRHPDVSLAVVLAREDHPGVRRLVAYAVPEPGRRLAVRELRRFLAEQLPSYMVPASFVVLPDLPRTRHDKVDRAALPPPDDTRREPDEDLVPPRTAVERAISAVWQEVLGLGRVGVDDSFFEIGGHSLLLSRVQLRLLEELGRELSIVDLFRHPTISALARFLDPAAEPVESAAARARGRAEARQASERGGAVAVVGMAGRFPGARTVAELWRNLCAGVESVTFLSAEELLAAGVDPERVSDPGYVRAAVVLDDIDRFDAPFFGFLPGEARVMDPQHRVFLECAWEALDDAGYDPSLFDGRIGVFAGAGMNAYLLKNLQGRDDLLQSLGGMQLMLGNDKDFVPTRVSYKLDLKGPSLNVQTACSTSLVAACLACDSLVSRQCDMALAGGITITLPQRAGYQYQEGGILSPDGHCRAFDAHAQGTLPGSGAGVVVLKRLEDALYDGDTIHAVIRGWALNNDGSLKVGYTAPSVDGQAEVIAEAQAVAGIDPSTVGYIEAHGTGTALGDPIEVAALTQAFLRNGGGLRPGSCALGSIKTNFGHLDSAAGVTGLLKAILSLEHRQIPPSLHFETPNPKIDFASSPFYVNTRLADWPAGPEPRRAGVSSFGIGGTNAHMVLEEAPAAPGPDPAAPWQLLVLSARSEAALDTASANLGAHLRRNPELSLADVSYTLQVGRKAFPHRRTLVCRTLDEAAAALEGLDPERVFTGRASEEEAAVAFLLPGGGTQYAGMGRELYRESAVFHQQLDACLDLLEPELRREIRFLLDPPQERRSEATARLEQTSTALPALFSIEYALARLLMSWGIMPRALIGHSLGEYTAACLSGVMSLSDALALVVLRGRLFERLPQGSMLSVPLPEEEVLPLLGPDFSIAAVNAPALCTVSGPAEALAELEGTLREQEIEARRLRIAVAAHSSLVEPILADFAAFVRGLRLHPPRIPFLSNVTGTWITAAEATDPAYWPRHLRQTVRFAAGARELLREPGMALLEVGPGRTLSTLAGQQAEPARRKAILTSLPHPEDREGSDLGLLLQTLGRLWTLGVPVDWQGGRAGERRRRIPLPAYPFERRRYWIDPLPRGVEARNGAAVAERLRLPCWRPAVPPRLSRADSNERTWLVLPDARGFGDRLAARLAARGDRVICPAPGEALAAHLAGCAPDLIVDLRDLDGGSLARRIGLARELAGRTVSVWVVSAGLREVTGAGTPQPSQAAGLALLDELSQAFPGPAWLSLDLPADLSGDEVWIDRCLAEITAGEPEAVVAWRGHGRWVPDLVEPDRASGPVNAVDREGETWVVGGGLAGPGLPLARHLLGARARVILLEPGAVSGEKEEALHELRRLSKAEVALGDLPSGIDEIAGVVLTSDLAERGPEETGGWDGWLEDLLAALSGLERRLRRHSPRAGLLLSRAESAGLAGALADFAFSTLREEPWTRIRLPAGSADEEVIEIFERVLAAGPVPDWVVLPAPRIAGEEEAEAGEETAPSAAADDAPRDETERAIAALWRQLLALDRVGIHDNYFELGGHSLLAIQLMSRLRERFRVQLPVSALFEAPTVAGLAQRLAQAAWDGWERALPPLRPAPRLDPQPVSLIQEALLRIERTAPESLGHRSVAFAFRLRGPLDRPTLVRCLGELGARHEILRVGFPEVEPPVLAFASGLIVEMPLVDLRQVPPALRRAELERLAIEDFSRGFDLASPPLWRATLMGVGQEEHGLFLVFHRLLFDGWSIHLFETELAALYEAFVAGRPSPLPPLPVQYADVAVWQRSWFEGERGQEQRAWWRERLAGDLPALRLPVDRPRPAKKSFRGARHSLKLPEALARELRALGQRERVTLFNTTLAAFSVFLHGLSGQDDLLIGSPAANRDRVETQALLGRFVNSYPLRLDLSGDPSFRDLLARTQDISQAAFARPDLPFESLLPGLLLADPASPFQSTFVMHKPPHPPFELPGGLTMSVLSLDRQITDFELSLSLAEEGEGLGGYFDYSTDLFETATLERFAGELEALLWCIVDDPGLKLSELTAVSIPGVTPETLNLRSEIAWATEAIDPRA